MTDGEKPIFEGEKPPEKGQSNSDLIQELREEFQAQLQAIKDENATREKTLSAEIEKLNIEKADLQRALVREATVAPVPKAPEKTEEELYRERINAIAQSVLKKEKEII